MTWKKPLLTKIHLSIRGVVDTDGKFDWASAIVDAAIISGIAFFTGLGTLAASNALTFTGVVVLLSAFGATFLGILATKRGLSNVAKTDKKS